MSRVVVYLRDVRWMRPVVDYCCANEHTIVGVVLDPDGVLWLTGVEQMIAAGDADIAVVADRGQIPPQPRVEVVIEQGQARPGLRPAQRRPEILRQANRSPTRLYQRPELRRR